MNVTRRLFAALVVGASALAAMPAMAQSGTPHLILTLPAGAVDIELLPEIAPKHVERIVTLASDGFYDGIVFHRVIEGFMAQTGDPTGTGMGGSELPDVEAEFNAESFGRGAVGAARSQDPNSFNSQFFIVYDDASFLDGQYTVFGKVVSGMEAVDALKKGSQTANGQVDNPDAIVSAKIEYR